MSNAIMFARIAVVTDQGDVTYESESIWPSDLKSPGVHNAIRNALEEAIVKEGEDSYEQITLFDDED